MELYTFLDFIFFVGSILLFSFSASDTAGLGTEGYLIFSIVVFFTYPILMELVWDLVFLVRPFQWKDRCIPRDRYPIFYHPRYNLSACGIEKMHPFDSQKYGRIVQFLSEDHKTLNTSQLMKTSGTVARSNLLMSMSKFYLFKLNYSLLLTPIIEIPLCFLPSFITRWRVLEPMLYATQGTIEAGFAALDHKWAINLGGGYHHASCAGGGGFCVYPDITLCIHTLRKFKSHLKKFLIIDLDAHQGNGHERDFLGDDDVFIMDVYNRYIYPGDAKARGGISLDIGAHSREPDHVYLQNVKDGLATVKEEFSADFILYNAGTDCMIGDPLGNLSLTPDGIVARDEVIFRFAFENRIPICMVLSGGYQQSNAPCIAESIDNLFKTFNLKTGGMADQY